MRGSDGCRSTFRCGEIFPARCERPAARRRDLRVPGRGRGPRRIARSSVATASSVPLMPSRSSGCLSSASSVTGAKPCSAASAASRAKIPAGVSASASPPESSTAIFQRASAASTRRAERAVRRHQRGGLAVMHRFAQRHRDGKRLFLGIGRFDHRERFERRRPRAPNSARRRSAATGRSRPPAAALRTPAARGRAAPAKLATSSRAMPMRVSSACMANCGCPERRRDAPALIAGDQLPRLLVEIGVEAGQHHGAVRQPRDGRDQFGGRRDRAGRAGGDHRPVGLARKPRGFGLDQPIAPRRPARSRRARASIAGQPRGRSAGTAA